jgi:hypothetical protein
MTLARRAALALAAGLVAIPAAAQDTSNDLDRLLALGLPVKAGAIVLHYSPSTAAVAGTYADALTDAVAWYRARLDWMNPVVMAVLDRDDYARVANVPYPVPYAERATGLVVMPDSIAGYPGFHRWHLDPVTLNANLTFHEIGHVIAWQTGIWSNSHWVNEFVADVFLAGYLRAEKPDDRTLLDGVPPGFEDAGKITSLTELDDRYAGVGLLNYAWFQFRLAALADFLVAGRNFAGIVDGLREAFPKQEYLSISAMPTPDEALRRLERTAPGIAAMAHDMTGPPNSPEVVAQPCGPSPDVAEAQGEIVVENRSDRTVALNNPEVVRTGVEIDVMMQTELEGEAREVEIDRRMEAAMASGDYAQSVEPGYRRSFIAGIGNQLKIVGGDCLIVGAGSARFVRDGT